MICHHPCNVAVASNIWQQYFKILTELITVDFFYFFFKVLKENIYGLAWWSYDHSELGCPHDTSLCVHLKRYLHTGCSQVIFWNIFNSEHKMPDISFRPSFSLRLAACRSVREVLWSYLTHCVCTKLVLCSLSAECRSIGMAEKWAGRSQGYHPHLAFTGDCLLPVEWQLHQLRNLLLFTAWPDRFVQP